MQLSDDWLDNVLDKTHDSAAADRLKDAMVEGRVETYVTAADKVSGTMSLIKVDAN